MEHLEGGGGGKTRFLTPASLMKTTFVYFPCRRSVTDSWPSSKRRCSLLAKTRHIGIFLNNGEERDSLVFLALCKQGTEGVFRRRLWQLRSLYFPRNFFVFAPVLIAFGIDEKLSYLQMVII
ncbi:hypothetical protein CDAR_60271 [Caerostris darwini]|uniref:Uncharacterized protein n=1 Tax=Caerostris darwini TaxID=1538125 RepID=A0AAV4QKB9_9ARAC|nr:hypothetical protein CDAR_60271 [Caerostris darwini]